MRPCLRRPNPRGLHPRRLPHRPHHGLPGRPRCGDPGAKGQLAGHSGVRGPWAVPRRRGSAILGLPHGPLDGGAVHHGPQRAGAGCWRRGRTAWRAATHLPGPGLRRRGPERRPSRGRLGSKRPWGRRWGSRWTGAHQRHLGRGGLEVLAAGLSDAAGAASRLRLAGAAVQASPRSEGRPALDGAGRPFGLLTASLTHGRSPRGLALDGRRHPRAAVAGWPILYRRRPPAPPAFSAASGWHRRQLDRAGRAGWLGLDLSWPAASGCRRQMRAKSWHGAPATKIRRARRRL
mmetsp:Transcript_85317/g.276251  ORF Transcript_85317/g.276251 Transcript_85317/m.276251 type:complete len:290 (-) Transcript_85317:55-924(-)